MTLNDILKKSIFSSVGTLIKEEDVIKFLEYVEYNKDFLSKFPYIIYSVNGDKNLCDFSEKTIKKMFPDSIVEFIFSENLGHTFGTFLIEYVIYERGSQLGQYEYIWKFSNDTIVNTDIFNIDIVPSDFYYINNLGYYYFIQNKDEDNNTLKEKVKSKEYFYPQTYFYIIKNKIKFYPNKESIYELYKIYKDRKDINQKPWECIPNCDCESFLKKTVVENKLSSHMLLNDAEIDSIINLIKFSKIIDGSHKNVLYKRFGNLCHLHWSDQPVIEI